MAYKHIWRCLTSSGIRELVKVRSQTIPSVEEIEVILLVWVHIGKTTLENNFTSSYRVAYFKTHHYVCLPMYMPEYAHLYVYPTHKQMGENSFYKYTPKDTFFWLYQEKKPCRQSKDLLQKNIKILVYSQSEIFISDNDELYCYIKSFKESLQYNIKKKTVYHFSKAQNKKSNEIARFAPMCANTTY